MNCPKPSPSEPTLTAGLRRARDFDERQVCIDDVLRISRVTAQVTQPRQPCFELGLRFEDQRMVPDMLGWGGRGWYLRVLEPGRSSRGR